MGLIYIEHIFVSIKLSSVCLSVVFLLAELQIKTIGPNSTKLWWTVFVCQTYQLKITAESAQLISKQLKLIFLNLKLLKMYISQ